MRCTAGCWNFGPLLLTELVEWSQDCRPSCSHNQEGIVLHTVTPSLWLLVQKPFCHNLVVCLKSLSVWKTCWQPNINSGLTALNVASIFSRTVIFLPRNGAYFTKCTNPSCSKERGTVNHAVIRVDHSVLQLTSLPPFLQKIMMAIMAKLLNFHFRPFFQNVISSIANKVFWAAFNGVIIKDYWYFGISCSIFTKSPAIAIWDWFGLVLQFSHLDPSKASTMQVYGHPWHLLISCPYRKKSPWRLNTWLVSALLHITRWKIQQTYTFINTNYTKEKNSSVKEE